MLIRCCFCGKPVFKKADSETVTCSYCFRRFLAARDQTVQICPENLDWEEPLFNAASEFRQGNEDKAVLLLLGSYQGAADLVKKHEERKFRELWETVDGLEKAALETEDPEQLEELIEQLQGYAENSAVIPNWDQRMEVICKRRKEVRRIFGIRRLQSLSVQMDEADTVQKIDGIIEDIHLWEKERDAAVLLRRAEQKKQQLQEKAERLRHERNRAQIASLAQRMDGALQPQEIDSAITELEKLREEPESGPVFDRAQIRKAELLREQRAAERRRRRQVWVKRGLAVSAAVVIAAVLWGLYCSHQERQVERLQAARTWVESGNYGEAVVAYSQILDASLVDKAVLQTAQEERQAAYLQYGETLAGAGEYEQAIEQFEQADASEKADEIRAIYAEVLIESEQYAEAVKILGRLKDQDDRLQEVYILLGNQYVQAGNFESAIKVYEKGGADSQTLSETYLIWGETLASEGHVLDAIRQLSQAEFSPQTEARIQELSVLAADEQFERVMQAVGESEQMTEEEICHVLAKYGESLRQINGQLRYCWHLLSSGYDLEQIYPDGVSIQWDALSGKLLYDKSEPDLSKVLVISRTEQNHRFSDEVIGDKNVQYRLRFQPGDWQKLSEEQRALSLEECTCILLADSTYEKEGNVHGRTMYPNYNDPKSTQKTVIYGVVSTYCAKEQVCLVSWPYGKRVQIIGNRIDRPRASSYSVDYTSSAQNILTLTLNNLELSGSFDEAWRRKQMDLAVSGIAEGQLEWQSQ